MNKAAKNRRSGNRVVSAVVVISVLFLASLFSVGCASFEGSESAGEGIDAVRDEQTHGGIGDGGQDGIPQDGVMTVRIIVQGKNEVFKAVLYENDSARAFYSRLPMTLNMSAMAHEKYCYLGEKLPVNAEKVGEIIAGDLMLWGKDCLVVFYESFYTSYSYTRICRISEIHTLADTLGSGAVTLIFEAEVK